MTRSLFDLLKDCTVKLVLSDREWGTGFFVAPGWILTCAHVVTGTQSESVQVIWRGKPYGTAQVNAADVRSEPIDLALLQFEPPDGDRPPCVMLDEAFEANHRLFTYGHPTEFPEGAGAVGICEHTAQSQGMTLIKFQSVQIQPGHSGSPLLNDQTGKVCGVVSETRKASTDLGGLAVPIAEVFRQFPNLRVENQRFHAQDDRWMQGLQVREQAGLKPAVKRFGVVYPRNVFFTGRETVLAKVHQRLGQTGATAINQGQAISGLGGIGKTQTAVEYAYRYFYDQAAYDWVFWVRADTELNLQTDLSDLAGQLQLPAAALTETEERLRAVLDWLETQGSWLLMFDNADHPD